jgi:AcrR family transcriptional regulator
LRERKKRQTRSRLIDATLELAERQGYEQTTVEQIADAVDVSPRTFARYFPHKNAPILTLIDLLTSAVNDEIDRIPPEVPPLPALLAANLAMLQRTRAGGGPMSSERFVTLLRIVNNSTDLHNIAVALRSQETCTTIAARSGCSPDDPAVVLISAVWAAILSTAWADLGTKTGPSLPPPQDLPEQMHALLTQTYDHFSSLCDAINTNNHVTEGVS